MNSLFPLALYYYSPTTRPKTGVRNRTLPLKLLYRKHTNFVVYTYIVLVGPVSCRTVQFLMNPLDIFVFFIDHTIFACNVGVSAEKLIVGTRIHEDSVVLIIV